LTSAAPPLSPLSLHDALPISIRWSGRPAALCWAGWSCSFLRHAHAEQPGRPKDEDQDQDAEDPDVGELGGEVAVAKGLDESDEEDRKSTRLNSSHQIISYAVF